MNDRKPMLGVVVDGLHATPAHALFSPLRHPAADLYETADEFVVEIDVPGYRALDLDVEIAGETVAVTGHKADDRHERGRAYHVRERPNGRFERVINLPAGADASRLTASLSDSVLALHAPKAVKPVPRRVVVGERSLGVNAEATPC